MSSHAQTFRWRPPPCERSCWLSYCSRRVAPVVELIRVSRLLGFGQMLKLRRAYRVGWDEMFRGAFATRTMQTFFNVGLIEAMENGATDIEAFAESRQLDAHILRSLCDAFYSLGLFTRQGSVYGLDDKGRLLVNVLRGWFDVGYGYDEIFHSLESLLRKERSYGTDVYRRSDFVAKGSGEMENWLCFPLVNDIITRNGYKRIMDLGCGDGTFLRKLCGMNPDVSCFGVDLSPDAVADGQRRAREAGLADRIHLFAGDIADIARWPEFGQPIDAATVFFVLHELLYRGEACVIAFLESFRRVLPGVPLIAFEAIRPSAEDMRRRPGIGIYYYLYHDLSHQKPVDRETWKRLFAQAGFTSIEERYLKFARTAIYTVR
jgi:SAM-dependent methyltransferase